MDFPTELKYTKDHEWVDDSKKPARVGVTQYAIEQLGDIVHIELPDAGTDYEAEAAFGTIESTKTVSDLYMPVGGKIVTVNNDVVDNPETLQDDPYGDGWLVEVDISGDGELLDSEAYEKFVSEQEE